MSGLIDKIAVLGREFTIQTEYLPGMEAKIRTLVYDGGRLVTAREISAGDGSETSKTVETTVRRQHRRITETLVKRAKELETTKTARSQPPKSKPAVVTAPPASAKKTSRPTVEEGSPLAVAIAVRQTIGPFSLAFAHQAPTTAEGYERTLDAVDAAIEAIRNAPTYDSIRLDEQLTMIALKSQLETWQVADKDIAMATEIWPGVERLAFHLQKINNRSDLVAFDHRLLTWSMSQLGRGEVTDDLIDALRGLGGRDAELDQIIRSPEGVGPFELLEVLLRLMDQTLA